MGTVEIELTQSSWSWNLDCAWQLQTNTDLFKAEMIDLKMLMNLKSDQIMEMMRDIGFLPWGHLHILRTTVEEMNKSLGGEELIATFATNETDDHIDEPSETCG